jgi:hypothetical protein
MIVYLPEVLQLVLNFCIGRICGGSEARTRLLSSRSGYTVSELAAVPPASGAGVPVICSRDPRVHHYA